MDRRAFITIVGGSILTVPLAVEAQPVGKVWRDGLQCVLAVRILEVQVLVGRRTCVP